MLPQIFRLIYIIEKKLYPFNTKRNTFSQFGEDLIIKHIFKMKGIHKPSYIDIGANHPFYISNTALLHQYGSRGVNIEANPDLLQKFKTYRSEDININIGISQENGELDFYIMEDNTLSTFSKEEYENMVKKGKKLKIIKKIKLTTIDYIINTYCHGQFPEFLSLDVEGFDLQILQSINYANNSPKVICVEAAEYSPDGMGVKRDNLINFLKSKGYFEYANTNLNAIMVQKDFWNHNALF